MNPTIQPKTTLSTLDDASSIDPDVSSAGAMSNDNAFPRRLLTNPNALLAHPELTRAIEGTLIQTGWPRTELPDGVAQVQMRVLEALRKKALPVDLGEWKALACTIAKRMVTKDRQRAKKRGRYDTGLSDEADAHAPVERSPGKVTDAVDLARQRKVLEGQFEAGDMPEQGEAILEGVVDGLSAKEIGAELGLTESAVKNRLSRMRKRFKGKLAALGILTLMMLVAVLFAAPFGGVATRDVTPAPGATTAQPRPQPPTETLAQVLRGQGLRACDAGEWDLCLGDLEKARTLDPAGDEEPAVRAARARAEDALDEQERRLEAKPRP
jgi:DNA-directed RNA polymerase specialized sigma24 family protein